jgi:uncharacterized protein YjbI with pentapeptide repeats
LQYADVEGAVLDGADLRGAILRSALHATCAQLSRARFDSRTQLPAC